MKPLYQLFFAGGRSPDNSRYRFATRFLPAVRAAFFAYLLAFASSPLGAIDFAPYQIIGDASSVAIGDINNDNRDDLVATVDDYQSSGPGILIWRQLPVGTLGEPEFVPINEKIGALANIVDLDDDGRKDVVVYLESGIGIFFQNSASELDSIKVLELGHFAYLPSEDLVGFSISAIDFNGDGVLDIAASSVNLENHEYVTYTNLFIGRGAGLFKQPVSRAVGIGGFVTSDVNSDGFYDLLSFGDPKAILGNSVSDQIKASCAPC